MDDNTTSELAMILSGWPQVTARLLAAHVAGPDGRCRDCTTANGVAQRWPCRLALLAQAAQAAQARRRVSPPAAHDGVTSSRRTSKAGPAARS